MPGAAFVYDILWTVTATYRASHHSTWTIDASPKEQFLYHHAGLAGAGGSSYIDSVIFRDRDANTAWATQADGTLEERVYYCQNWRADVIALMTSAGRLINQVRYDPYGVPFGIAKTDLDGDGDVDSNDSSRYTTLYNSGAGTHPYADWNWDGTTNITDQIAFLNDYNADSGLGRGVLAYGTWSDTGAANRKGYARDRPRPHRLRGMGVRLPRQEQGLPQPTGQVDQERSAELCQRGDCFVRSVGDATGRSSGRYLWPARP